MTLFIKPGIQLTFPIANVTHVHNGIKTTNVKHTQTQSITHTKCLKGPKLPPRPCLKFTCERPGSYRNLTIPRKAKGQATEKNASVQN